MTDENKNIPDWKADFPIKKTEAGYVARRDFLKVITLFSGIMAAVNVFIPVFNFFHKRKVIKDYFVCNASELKVGTQKTFYVDGDHRNPYMLIRLAEDDWRVYEQKCTHLSCSVIYDHEHGMIECPCHHGFFDAKDGKVLQGPPPRPLPRLNVVVKDGKIFVEDYTHEQQINHKAHS